MLPKLTFLSTMNDKYLINFQIVIKEIQLNNFCKFSLNNFPKRNTLPGVEEAVTYRRFREEKRRFGKSNGSESRIFSSYVYFDSWSTASCLSGSMSDPENFFTLQNTFYSSFQSFCISSK